MKIPSNPLLCDAMSIAEVKRRHFYVNFYNTTVRQWTAGHLYCTPDYFKE